MKGMVLAAGFGERMRPLSEHLPKPMFPAGNLPLIDFALHRLSRLGVDEVVVNLHHLPDPIREHLGQGSRFDQSIAFSEEPVILGTGGGIKAVREWLRTETFCVTNADTLLLSAMEPILSLHKESGALATMALLPKKTPGRFSDVSVNEAGEVVDIGGQLKSSQVGQAGTFVGVHVIEPEIFDHMPDRDFFCIVQDVYLPLIKKQPGSVAACLLEGAFFDMGTPADYLRGNLSLLLNHLNESSELVKGMCHLGDRVFIGQNLHLGRGVNLLGPCIIGDDVRIEGGSQIGPGTVVGKGAYLGAWSRLAGCVVWPGTLLPGGGQHKEAILYDRQVLDVKPEME